MRKSIAVVILLIGSTLSFAQVEINAKTTKKEKKTAGEKSMDGTTSVYLLANWSHTNRKLVPNDGLFGDTLGVRADEEKVGAWSFGIGLQNQLHKYVLWEGGITYMTNGEMLSVSTEDTSYKYQNTYSYIAMPLKLHFTYGESITLMAGAGIVPQMFLNSKQERNWRTSDNESHSETIKTKIGFNSFVLSAVFNLGVKANLGGRWSVFAVPEYKLQLSSSYDKNNSYKHYARSMGINFGLIVDL